MVSRNRQHKRILCNIHIFTSIVGRTFGFNSEARSVNRILRPTSLVVGISTLALTAVALVGCGGQGQTDTAGLQAPSSQEVQAKIAIPEPDEVKVPGFITEQIGSDRRKAVIYEAFYALRQSWINPPNQNGPYGGNQLGGCVVGDWPYLGSDPGQLNYVTKRIYRSNASISSLDMSTSTYDMYGGYERAGQCLFFANLILRRALNYDLPVAWASYPTNGPSAQSAQAGDVVYYRNYKVTGNNHIGIVVLTTSGGMDIVDSNYVGSISNPIRKGYPDSEIIGRHWVPTSDIGKYQWKVYSGKGRWY